MAKIGFKYFAWAKMASEPNDAEPTYAPGEVLGRAVSSNLAVTNASGELYADDQLAEYIEEFASGTLTAEVDNIELAGQAKLYGARFVNGELRNNSSDTPPYGAVGGYQVVMVRNVRKFRAWILTKCKAAVPDEDNTTKGGNISFGTQPISMRVMQPTYGDWKITKEFTTEAAAKAYIDTYLGVAVWHAVDVQVQGETESKFAMPMGLSAVANGAAFELEIAGTPTALYDNGVEKSADIAAGKYTIAATSGDHKIAVIF